MERDDADQLVLVTADLTQARFLTTEPDGDHWDPQPSPDGKQLAFVFRRFDDINRLDIFVLNLTTGELRMLYGRSKTRVWNPRWSPDGGDVWQDLYAFTVERRFLVDYEMANDYVSTFPASRFVQTLTVQLPTSRARYLLQGYEYQVLRGSVTESRMIKDDDLLQTLAEVCGLKFPAGTRFRSQIPRLERLLGAERHKNL